MAGGENPAAHVETTPVADQPPEATAVAVELPLDFQHREVVLRADFDDLDDEGCIWVSLRFLRGPRHPRAGETVYLLGTRGRACMGEVTSVHGWVARVKLDGAAGRVSQRAS